MGQDSVKPFEMCCICNGKFIEPVACDQGHMFCRPCVIEYLVKQKKKIAENASEIEKLQRRQEQMSREKELEAEVRRVEQFEKFDGFAQITERGTLLTKEETASTGITAKDVKPIGIYELNPKKEEYVKTAFWTLENTPASLERVEREPTTVYCPASKHKLTMKKLRSVVLRELEAQYCCWICSKEVKRQRVGVYRCGHLVCEGCRSNMCEVCQETQGWTPIENGSSAYAAHNKAEVKTYTHAFVG